MQVVWARFDCLARRLCAAPYVGAGRRLEDHNRYEPHRSRTPPIREVIPAGLVRSLDSTA